MFHKIPSHTVLFGLLHRYVGDNIQKAGVAVETQGFTFVRHGRRRETLLVNVFLHVKLLLKIFFPKAEAVLLSMRQFRELEAVEGKFCGYLLPIVISFSTAFPLLR